MNEPPVKRIKSGSEFVDLINECYDLKFRNFSAEETDCSETVKNGVMKIVETLDQANSSSDVSFGLSRTSAKINWGKCLGLLLEEEPESLKAVKILTEKLNPGGGLL